MRPYQPAVYFYLDSSTLQVAIKFRENNFDRDTEKDAVTLLFCAKVRIMK